MYMTMEFNPFSSGAVPKELRMKIQTHDGPMHAVVTWDPENNPIRIDDETMMINCDIRVNRTHGVAAFVMYGSRITSVVTGNGASVEIRSLKFSENKDHAGFAVDGLPKTFVSADPVRESVPEYFCRKGLFVSEPKLCGGLHMLPFDEDVGTERIESFLKSHPDTPLGAFCSAAVPDRNGNPYWVQCYLYAHMDHASTDLSVWKSKDIHNGEA